MLAAKIAIHANNISETSERVDTRALIFVSVVSKRPDTSGLC